MNGIEAISSLKALLPTTSIVMLTISDDADTILSAFQAGASGYLFKSVSLDHISNAIKQASEGGLLMPSIVAEKVLDILRGTHNKGKDSELTARELEVLGEMAEGFSQKEIADRLFIGAATVNTHIQNIYKKLHVRCAPAAVAKAIRDGIIA